MAAGITEELSAISFAPGEALFFSSNVQVRLRMLRRSSKCCLQLLSFECFIPSALKLLSFLSDMVFGTHPSVCTVIVGLSSSAV